MYTVTQRKPLKAGHFGVGPVTVGQPPKEVSRDGRVNVSMRRSGANAHVLYASVVPRLGQKGHR